VQIPVSVSISALWNDYAHNSLPIFTKFWQIEAANNVACKINDIIVSIRSKRLTNAAHGSAKDLWAQIRSKAKTRNKPILMGGNAVNADQLNQYFAGISTDPDCTVSGVTRFYRQNSVLPGTPSFNEIHGYEIEPILRRVKNTATGCDNLPAWLFINALSSWLTW